MYTQRSGSLDA